MTTYYIPSSNEIINANCIIRARYEPEYIFPAGFDDYGREQPDRTIQSKLTMTLKELKLETVDGYDGAFRGVASKSAEMVVRGVDADSLWARLRDNAANIFPQDF